MSEALTDDLLPAAEMIAVRKDGPHNIVVPLCVIAVFQDIYCDASQLVYFIQ
jgi:hypothetical protein